MNVLIAGERFCLVSLVFWRLLNILFKTNRYYINRTAQDLSKDGDVDKEVNFKIAFS